MRQFAFLIFLLVISANTLAQILDSCSISIQGKVLDAQELVPLEFAHISVHVGNETRNTYSNEKGDYAVTIPCGDSLFLRVSYLGYLSDEGRFSGMKNLDVTHQLVYSNQLFAPVLIKSERKIDPLVDEVQRIRLNSIDQVSSVDFSASSAALPRVRRKSSGSNSGKPLIRGFYGARVALLVEGLMLFNQQWGEEHAPELFPAFYQEMQLLSDAELLRYSHEGIGGAINMEKRIDSHDSLIHYEAYFSLRDQDRKGSLGLNVFQNNPKYNLAWRAQVFMNKGGTLKTPDGFLSNTGSENRHWSYDLKFAPKNHQINLHFTQFKTRLGIFQGAHLGNLSDLERAIDSDELLVKSDFNYNIGLPRQEVLHDFLRLNYSTEALFQGNLSFQIARQFNRRQEYDLIRARDENQAAMELNKTTWNTSLNWKKSVFDKARLHLGLQGAHIKNTNGAIIFIPNYLERQMAAFLSYEHELNSLFQLQSTLRYDAIHRKVFDFQNGEVSEGEWRFDNWSAALDLGIHPSSKLSFQLELSSMWRPPAMNELFASGLHHGAAALEFGNEELEKEESHKLNLSANWNNKQWKISGAVFYNMIDNFIYLDPRAELELTIRGAFPAFDQKQASAHFYGGEVWGEFAIGHWRLTESISVVEARKNGNEALPQIPPFQLSQALHYSWSTKQKPLGIQLEHQYTAAQNFFDPALEVALPPSSFHLFNALMDYEINSAKVLWSFQLGVQNIFNLRYFDYLNRQRFFAPELGRQVFISFKINH